MGLQDDALVVFQPRSGRLAHDNVACGVFESLYTGLFGEVEQELLHFFEMSGRTWNLGQRMEVAPDTFGIQIFDHSLCCL